VLTANYTISPPTNAVNGQIFVWTLKQDSIGGRVITFPSNMVLTYS
jgi:hypothetical protein